MVIYRARKHKFYIIDKVSWNFEEEWLPDNNTDSYKRFSLKGYTHHVKELDPQYEIKSKKTDDTTAHKETALIKISWGQMIIETF